MDVRLNVQYHLIVTQDEFRLVSKALRRFGASEAETPGLPPVTDKDRQAAKDLQEGMLRSKASQVTQMANEALKAVENIEDGKK